MWTKKEENASHFAKFDPLPVPVAVELHTLIQFTVPLMKFESLRNIGTRYMYGAKKWSVRVAPQRWRSKASAELNCSTFKLKVSNVHVHVYIYILIPNVHVYMVNTKCIHVRYVYNYVITNVGTPNAFVANTKSNTCVYM